MEVSVQPHRNGVGHNQNRNRNNVSANGSASNGRMPHKPHHTKVTTPLTSEHEFCATDKQSSNENKKDEKQKQSAEETKQQTEKIMKAFLNAVVDQTGIAEKIRKESRQRYDVPRSVSTPQSQDTVFMTPSTSEGRRPHERATLSRRPLRKESDDEKLMKVMKGVMPDSLRHRSDASLASSDSADSGLKDARFKRSKSFSRAQRHSMVTELENQQTGTTSRRNSEDIPQTLPLESSLPNSLKGVDSKKAASPVSHTRAVSDPVAVSLDVTGRHKFSSSSKDNKEKDKEKKKFWKRKKRKKDAHRSKEDTNEQVGTSYQSQKLSREESTTSKRRTPSPPQSPKRTPKLFRKLSKKLKGGKAETPTSNSLTLTESSSSSKSTSRSKSLEFDAINNGVSPNGDSKSNSLPMEVTLSTKPSSEIKYKAERSQGSTHADSLSASGKKTRRNSEEVLQPRPDSLDLRPKKKSTFKRIKDFFLDSSSSSSSDEDENPRKPLHPKSQSHQQTVTRGQSLQEVPRRSVKHSNSDKPSIDDVRDRYQHRSTKSMSDIDPLDKNCSEIGLRLRRVAEQLVMHYGGPTGRTQTPDSYHLEMHRGMRKGKKTDQMKQVTRAATLPSAPSVQSHSMKAYYNMKERSKNINNLSSDSRTRRITRDEIDHRPTQSLDSPRTYGVEEQPGSRWSDRIGKEKSPRFKGRDIDGSHTKEPDLVQVQNVQTESRRGKSLDSPTPLASNVFPPPGRSNDPHHHHDRHSQMQSDDSKRPGTSPHRSLPHEPIRSASPNLRASRPNGRNQGPSLDQISRELPHIHRHIERHTDTTTTVSSPGCTRRIITHVDVIEDIDTDALPNGDNEDGDEGFGAAFRDVDDDNAAYDETDASHIIREQQETTTVTNEVSNYSARPLVRQRAATSPDIYPHLSFDDEDELDDIDEPGAVGGTQEEEEVDVDDLVTRISQALRQRGDRMEAETPQLDDLNRTLGRLSSDVVKDVMNRALTELTASASKHFSHPETIEIVILFDMAQIFGRISTQPSSFLSLVNSLITPMVERIGGWSIVQSSLDETEKEITTLDNEEEPGPSGTDNEQKRKGRRKSDTGDPDGDLD